MDVDFANELVKDSGVTLLTSSMGEKEGSEWKVWGRYSVTWGVGCPLCVWLGLGILKGYKNYTGVCFG